MNWQETAFLFPGQGSQAVGMGAEIAENYPLAKALYDKADEVLGFSLSNLCFEGPEDDLNETSNTQPALYVTSLAILKALQTANPDAKPRMIAGHSLGEITALAAAGAMSFEDGLRLVHERGRLMKEAGEKSPGAMAAILGVDTTIVKEICEAAAASSGAPLVLANDNCPGQVVISGDEGALDKALAIAQERGARRAVKLAVSVAAHSPLMASSAEEFGQIVSTIPIQNPKVPVVANSTVELLDSIEKIQVEVSAQLTSPVRWTESIEFMREQGITTFIEFGPKAVLKGLLRRIDRNLIGIAVETPADIETMLV